MAYYPRLAQVSGLIRFLRQGQILCGLQFSGPQWKPWSSCKPTYPAFGLLSQHQTNHTLSLNYTRIFSNSLRQRSSRWHQLSKPLSSRQSEDGQWMSSVGFTSDETDFLWSGCRAESDRYSRPSSLCIRRVPGNSKRWTQHRSSNGSKADNVWRHDQLDQGKHSIRAGLDIVHNQAVDGFALNRNNPARNC